MLNDLIRKSNMLASEIEALRYSENEEEKQNLSELEAEYNTVLNDTLSCIKSNNIPTETVLTIEDRILNEIAKKNDENKIRDDYENLRRMIEDANKNIDWLARADKSGYGMAQAVYMDCKARLNDMKSEVKKAPRKQRVQLAEKLKMLESECDNARAEYERVGNSDRDVLASQLAEYNQYRDQLVKSYEECEQLYNTLPLQQPLNPVVNGGVVARELGLEFNNDMNTVSPDQNVAQPDSQGMPMDGVNETATATTYTNVDNFAGVNNDDVKFVLEDIRYQSKMELVKIKAELEEIKANAHSEYQKMMEEIVALRDEITYINEQAEQVRWAVSNITKARNASVEYAKQCVSEANKAAEAVRYVTNMVDAICAEFSAEGDMVK